MNKYLSFLKYCSLIAVSFYLISVAVANASTFKVADFGATGDGVTDDGPAIRSAVAAAVAAGSGSRVVFEDKTYRLDHYPSTSHHIDLENVSDIYFEGNGALLINNPRNSIFNLTNCSGVTVTGFQFDMYPLPFTQGTVVAADPDGKWFDMVVHSGYRCPVEEFENYGDRITPIQNTWGMFFDPIERHRKPGVEDHIRMQDVQLSPQEGAVLELKDPTISRARREGRLNFVTRMLGAETQHTIVASQLAGRGDDLPPLHAATSVILVATKFEHIVLGEEGIDLVAKTLDVILIKYI